MARRRKAILRNMCWHDLRCEGCKEPEGGFLFCNNILRPISCVQHGQKLLGKLDIVVSRNYFGRQKFSFEEAVKSSIDGKTVSKCSEYLLLLARGNGNIVPAHRHFPPCPWDTEPRRRCKGIENFLLVWTLRHRR